MALFESLFSGSTPGNFPELAQMQQQPVRPPIEMEVNPLTGGFEPAPLAAESAIVTTGGAATGASTAVATAGAAAEAETAVAIIAETAVGAEVATGGLATPLVIAGVAVAATGLGLYVYGGQLKDWLMGSTALTPPVPPAVAPHPLVEANAPPQSLPLSHKH